MFAIPPDVPNWKISRVHAIVSRSVVIKLLTFPVTFDPSVCVSSLDALGPLESFWLCWTETFDLSLPCVVVVSPAAVLVPLKVTSSSLLAALVCVRVLPDSAKDAVSGVLATVVLPVEVDVSGTSAIIRIRRA